MAKEITHKFVRDLAKNLRERTGRDIKHTEIIADIARAAGERPDALMHALKSEAAASLATAHPVVTAPYATLEAAGFAVWDTGGGCTAWGRSLRKEVTTDDDGDEDENEVDVKITTDDGSSHEGDTEAPVWEVGLNVFTPDGSDTVAYMDELTLAEAVAVAADFAKRADEVWVEYVAPAAPKP